MPSVVIIPQAWNFFNVRMFVVKYIQVYLKLCGKFTLKKLFKFKTNNCKKNITGVCIQNLIDWCMYHNINNTFEEFLFRNIKNNLRAINLSRVIFNFSRVLFWGKLRWILLFFIYLFFYYWVIQLRFCFSNGFNLFDGVSRRVDGINFIIDSNTYHNA